MHTVSQHFCPAAAAEAGQRRLAPPPPGQVGHWGEEEPAFTAGVSRGRAREISGLVLAGLGALMLIGNLGWGHAFWGMFQAQYLWPLVLIALGVALITRQRN